MVALTEPRDGVPTVLTRRTELARYAEALAAGRGPVAVDAERASGFRYGQRAYLVQLRREGAGTALIDPIALPDLSVLQDALRGTEWVLHAASQDLPCLAEVGLVPDSLFDTELAGRLLGRPRVGLAALVAEELGLSLAKEHSAADWSTRPLPGAWLRYAALDVEVLVELRDRMAAHLAAAGKQEWAAEEFEAVRTAPPPPPRPEPWRRTSGITALRDGRRLAVVRALWLARDRDARERDLAPGRVLPDRALMAAATALPRSERALAALPEFSGKGTRRRLNLWWTAIQEGLAVREPDLPSRRGPALPIPAPRSWPDRFPEAAERLVAVRARMRELAEQLGTPQENLLAPEVQRRLAWEPPASTTPESVAQSLQAAGARRWQAEVTAVGLAAALRDPASAAPAATTGTAADWPGPTAPAAD